MEEQKRKPGRPRKPIDTSPPPLKRPRGRPRKDATQLTTQNNALAGEVMELKGNAKAISHLRQLEGLPKYDHTNPLAVKERIMLYKSICQQNDEPTTPPGLAVALGIHTKTLHRWARRETQKQNGDVIEEALTFIEAFVTSALIKGETRDSPGIFLSKNWFGYKDVNDIALAPPNPQGELVPIEVLEQKFAELPED